ncbi:MAG TPA: SMC-Scp complex subunit ScpB [Pseudonocardiaceae bacterium]|nr:SMC-Scp complex subunit ScpB [Pseudonocardiaceae bacterium]
MTDPEPLAVPAEPTETPTPEPAEPIAAPKEPDAESEESPAQPADELTQPSVESEEPIAAPTEPVEEPDEPPAESAVELIEATAESEESPAAPTHELTEPSVEPDEPAEPSVVPDEQPAEPTEPSVEPEEPAEESAEPAEEPSDLPALADDAELANALEALLLVVDAPAGEELLAVTLEQSVARITEALHRMSADLTDRDSGIDLRRVGDGWRFVTRDKYAPYVEKFLLDGQRAKLTRAALETLAVIAYRQPVTRGRVAAVRGVNVDGVIRTLVSRGLISETGTDTETGGILYRTTELFLERLGLPSLEDLPAIAPLLPEVDAIDDV